MIQDSTQNLTWYPCPPPDFIPELKPNLIDNEPIEPIGKIWTPDGPLRYLTSNIWSSEVSEQRKESCRRHHLNGTEVRTLPKCHALNGQKGLFAKVKFSQYDVLGEYTGNVLGDNAGGLYCAALEDRNTKESLGVNAEECGNEMRFINSYLNIDFEPNLTMRTVYTDTYPHLVLVCTKNIEVDDEFLLDYGEAYNQAYLTPKLPNQSESAE
eukprot:gene5357-10708_t